jgi:hypothetical protein
MPERTCPSCGETVPDAQYCLECGEPLKEPEDAGPLASEEGAVPPLPSEESPGDQEDAAPGQPGGYEQSGADLPPSQEPPRSAEEAAASEEQAPVEGRGDGVQPEELQARGPHQEPVVAGATPMQQAAEDARAPAPPMDGQLRCPDCGEAVYSGERVCWSCSRRLEVGEVQTEAEEPEPGGPPEAAGPVPRQVPTATGGAGGTAPTGQVSGYSTAAEQPQQRTRPEPSDEAMSYAWWSFGLGLLSVFTCGVLGLLGIAALWLGVSAARRDAGPVAIAGAVFGAIGLLMFMGWVVALAVAMPQMMQSAPTHIILPVFL